MATVKLYSTLTKTYYTTLYSKEFDKGEQLYRQRSQVINTSNAQEQPLKQKNVIPKDVFVDILRKMKENAKSGETKP